MTDETIFTHAIVLAPEQRAAYLDEACAGDAELRARVERLLRSHDMAGSFLATPAVEDVAGSDLDVTIKAAPGTLPQPSGAESTMGPSSANPSASVPFIFGRRIAQGGMGAILEADDCKLGRKIAAKVMLLEQDATEEMRQRFIQEAAVLAKLAHPNIVPVYDLGHDTEGQLYYTMKLVKGRTLQDILDNLRLEHPEALREFTLDRLLTIFRKVADALAFAHSKGIIHRDLKPENVMVGEFGEVLLMDWGLAKMTNVECGMPNDGAQAANDPNSSFDIQHSTLSGSPTHTIQGAVMGTPKYMSPEQAMGQIDELDERSDIFSLGGILYAILTLRPPVEGKTLEEVLTKVRGTSITPPTTFGTTSSGAPAKAKGDVLEAKAIKPLPHIPAGRVPAALSAVAMKALTLDKAKRYQDVAAFSADIEKFQTGFATSAEQAGLATQLVLLIKRNRGIFSTAAAAWLLITALAVWFVFNLRAKEQRASKAEAVAVQEKETARQALAKSQLDLAEKEFERGKFVEARKILEETPESFRDANWRFLRAHSSDFTARLSLHGKGAALRLQFLPQGDRFAARCNGGVIGIFSLTGRQIGDWVPVNGSGAFRIDSAGSRMAFAASASEVAVQEVATGNLVHRWTCEPGENKHVLLSPDGATVVVAAGRQLTAHATETGAPLWTQPFHYVVPAFSPDGRTVAIVAAGTALALKIELRDTLTGTVRSTLEASADNDGKEILQFNQAGDRLACFGRDEVILWNPQTATKIRGLHFPGETVKLLSPGGDAVATISGSRIRLWDTATGRLLRSFNGANTDALDLAFSPDGRMLLSTHVAAENAIVHVWPTRLGEEIASARPGGIISRVLFDRDGSTFYTSARDAAAWEIRSGLEKWTFSAGSNHRALDLALHPGDGSIILSAIGKNEFTHVASTGEALAPFGINHGSSLKFNRSGQLLLEVEGAFHQTYPGPATSVLEYPSGKVLRRILHNHPRQPFAAFCLEDAAVATAALAGGITVWDWKAGTPLHQIAAAQTGSIACLASSPDGRHLATGGPDRWIRIWEAKTGRLEAAFRAHWEGVRCVKFSLDGREILSGSEDGTVRLHDAATGKERLAFYSLTAPVVDADISADGKFIAAITTEGVTKVWDRQRSSEAALLPKRPAAIKPAVAKDAEGWEDLLAPLTPDEVEQTGHGWRLKDGEVFSPDTKHATLPLPGEVSGTSYQVRVKLRQLANKQVFHIVLPVADQMCGFELDGRPHGSIYTGLILVDGKFGKYLPGTVEGQQVNDAEPHELEVTVRLGGANATITTTLDGKPLYAWTGPIAALSQHPSWATTEPGALALGTHLGGWAVSGVKVKRLDGSNASTPGLPTMPAPTAPLPVVQPTGALGTQDKISGMKNAALLVWFGKDQEHRTTSQRMLESAANTESYGTAERVAKIACLRPIDAAETRKAALDLARKAVELGKDQKTFLPWAHLTLGMAEHRSGHYPEAATALGTAFQTAAETNYISNQPRIESTANFYLAMCLFQQGKQAEARSLFAATEAKMKPLPADEQNPLAEGASHDDLILWLASKEAKALLAGAEAGKK